MSLGSLPVAAWSVAQLRRFEAYAIGTQHISGYTLMERAAAGALRVLRARWPQAQRIVVVAGGGNNGGDGFALARLARAAGLEVRVLTLVGVADLRGEARQACDDFIASGGRPEPFVAAALHDADVVVDAMLGIGLHAPLRQPYGDAIRAVNAAAQPVLALDLPSGLDADRGTVADVAVQADATVTFIALKSGLLLGEGPALCGVLSCDDLQLGLPGAPDERPVLTRLVDADIAAALPVRALSSHKGSHGRALLIGGGPGMLGAIQLAGTACLRAGAGLVRIATRPEHAAAIAAARPELICHGVADHQQLEDLLRHSDVVGIGPGLGRDVWARRLLAAALECGKPLLLDADALNLLAESPHRLPAGTLLTPHPGEAARLLHTDAATVQGDRLAALQALVTGTQAVVALKGAGTLVGAPGQVPAICPRGNPGMATAGMGDVLAGAALGILAQCRDPWRALRAAVLAHAQAGDECAAQLGTRGLLAGDVAAMLPRCINRRA